MDARDFVTKVDAGDMTDVVHGLYDGAVVMVGKNHPSSSPLDRVTSAEATLIAAVVRESLNRMLGLGLSATDSLRNAIRAAQIAAITPLGCTGKPIPSSIRGELIADFAKELERAHLLQAPR